MIILLFLLVSIILYFKLNYATLLTIILGSNGINWVTDDCGANLRALNSGKRIHEFHYHPK
jgi:hypothetical protein